MWNGYSTSEDWEEAYARHKRHEQGIYTPPRTPSPPPTTTYDYHFNGIYLKLNWGRFGLNELWNKMIDFSKSRISYADLKTFLENNSGRIDINSILDGKLQIHYPEPSRILEYMRITPLFFAYLMNNSELVTLLLSPPFNADPTFSLFYETFSNGEPIRLTVGKGGAEYPIKNLNDFIWEGIPFGRDEVNLSYIARGLQTGVYTIDRTNPIHRKYFLDKDLWNIVNRPSFTSCSNLKLGDRPPELVTAENPIEYKLHVFGTYLELLLKKCGYNIDFVKITQGVYYKDVRPNLMQFKLLLLYGDNGMSKLFTILNRYFLKKKPLSEVKTYLDENVSDIDFNETIRGSLYYDDAFDYEKKYKISPIMISPIFLAYFYNDVKLAKLLIETYNLPVDNTCRFEQPITVYNKTLNNFTDLLTHIHIFPNIDEVRAYIMVYLLNNNLLKINLDDIHGDLSNFILHVNLLEQLAPDSINNVILFNKRPDEVTFETPLLKNNLCYPNVIKIFNKLGYNISFVFSDKYTNLYPREYSNIYKSKVEAALRASSNDYYKVFTNIVKCMGAAERQSLVRARPEIREDLIAIGNGTDKLKILSPEQWADIQKFLFNKDLKRLPSWYKFPVYPYPELVIPQEHDAVDFAGMDINDGDILVNFKGGGHPMIDSNYNPRQKWESEYGRYYLLSTFTDWVLTSMASRGARILSLEMETADRRNGFIKLLEDEPGRTVNYISKDNYTTIRSINLESYKNPAAGNHIYGIEFCIARLEEPVAPNTVRNRRMNMMNNPTAHNVIDPPTRKAYNRKTNIPRTIPWNNTTNNIRRNVENVQPPERTGPVRRTRRVNTPVVVPVEEPILQPIAQSPGRMSQMFGRLFRRRNTRRQNVNTQEPEPIVEEPVVAENTNENDPVSLNSRGRPIQSPIPVPELVPEHVAPVTETAAPVIQRPGRATQFLRGLLGRRQPVATAPAFTDEQIYQMNLNRAIENSRNNNPTPPTPYMPVIPTAPPMNNNITGTARPRPVPTAPPNNNIAGTARPRPVPTAPPGAGTGLLFPEVPTTPVGLPNSRVRRVAQLAGRKRTNRRRRYKHKTRRH